MRGFDKVYNETVKSVTEQVTAKFNTAIAQLMVFGQCSQRGRQTLRGLRQRFIQLIAPFAPSLGRRTLAKCAATGESISCVASWPTWDESKLVEDEIEIAVQNQRKVSQIDGR